MAPNLLFQLSTLNSEKLIDHHGSHSAMLTILHSIINEEQN